MVGRKEWLKSSCQLCTGSYFAVYTTNIIGTKVAFGFGVVSLAIAPNSCHFFNSIQVFQNCIFGTPKK